MIELEKSRNIQEIIQDYLGPEKLLVDVKVSRLNPIGENYLSLMLKIEAVVENREDSKREKFHAVAKCISEYEFSKEAFSYTFENELRFYTGIVPTLQQFLKENGKEELNIFPKFIGARPKCADESIDENSVLVLENLKEEGFRNVDRFLGFDSETARLTLRDLAAFHAVPLALKLKRLDVFEEKIRKYCSLKLSPPPYKMFVSLMSMVCEILEEHRMNPEDVSKIRSGLEFYAKNVFELRNNNFREPFATLSHFDVWVNNTMQKFENGRAIENKFVDFQMCLYESPVQDLLFFLFSSVKLTALEDHFDDFIQFYHENFVKHLKELDCDTRDFQLDNFLKEVDRSAFDELIHVLFMTFVIFGKKGTVLEPGQLPGTHNKKEDLDKEIQDKLAFVADLCSKRGWIS